MRGEGIRTPVDLAHEAAFILGAIEVRPASREIVIAGKSQALQPRVMQVLVALARRRGEVVSRDDLVASCWDGLSVSEDAISRCIAALRRLSEQEGAAFSIETIPRIGYRVVDRFKADETAEARAAASSSFVSIAVLPFVNMSSDPEQEYFSDGLSEELLNQLAQMQELRVVGRTSSFAFRGKNEDLRVIGRQLGVEHVLEGSVRKSGERLRITAQLVNCADGYHLWSQSYDRQLNDVFAIQEDVARAVTEALGVTLGVGPAAPDYGGTKSFDAFDHFLKGRLMPGILVRGDQFISHLTHLRRALEIDPRYAVAWAYLANLIAFTQNFVPADEARSLDAERDEAAGRAFALAPEIPVVNVAEGWRQADNRNWIVAETAFMRAIAPGRGRDPYSEGVVGAYLSNTGRVRDGLILRTKARDSDPLWLGWSGHVLLSTYTLRMWDRFDAEYRRSKELPGDRSGVEMFQLMRLMVTGAPQEEIGEQIERTLSWKEDPLLRTLLREHGRPRKALEALRGSAGDGSAVRLFELASFAGVYGDTDLVIENLRLALPDTRLVLVQQLWRPEFGAARKDPRFKDIVREIGLADFWRQTGKWGDFARPLGDDDFEIVAEVAI